IRATLAGHEVDTMGDQPIGRPIPAALLGNREGIDLARLRAHALGLHQRRGVEAKSLVEAAMAIVGADGRPKRQRLLEQPVTHTPPPGAALDDAAMRRREPGLQPAGFLQLLDYLLDVLAVADRRDESGVGRG